MLLQEVKVKGAVHGDDLRYRVRLGTEVAGSTRIYIETNVSAMSPAFAAEAAKKQVSDHLQTFQDALMRDLAIVNVTPTTKQKAK